MAQMPNPFPSLLARIKRIEDRQNQQLASSPFFGTGMHPNGNGGIDSDNFAAGTSGYSFKADGDAEFNDLTLRGGIIGNDALTNPVVPQVLNLASAGFSVGASWSEALGGNVTVPADCTRLLAFASGWAYAVNPNTTGGSNGTGGDALYCATVIGGTSGEVNGDPLSGSNGFTTASSGVSVLKTGLTPGTSIHFEVDAIALYQAFGSDPTNNASLAALLIWLR